VSEENVETVKRVDALLCAGDVEGALAQFHPGVEWRIIGAKPPIPSGGRGIDSLRKLFTPEANPEIPIILPHAEADEYIDAGSCVIAIHRPPLLDDEDATVFELEDGKIVREVSGYPSRAAALQAVGPQR